MRLAIKKLDIKKNVELSKYTTLEIGGPAGSLVVVTDEETLVVAIDFAQKNNLEFMVIAGGSNLLISDAGYPGLVIVNKVSGIEKKGDKAIVKSGTPLSSLVEFALENGLAGIECLTGIPGSVGGAVYGNAGAYGQAISDYLLGVSFIDAGRIRKWSKSQCEFSYRESSFKKNRNRVILSVTFEFPRGDSGDLQAKSEEILSMRLKKYPPEIKCPGSFFKNVIAADLAKSVLSRIPPEKIIYGKIPSGYLLEEVGAKGDTLGAIRIADYHGNLFMNTGCARASDLFKLARKCKDKVYKKFGIELESEVQLVGFRESL